MFESDPPLSLGQSDVRGICPDLTLGKKIEEGFLNRGCNSVINNHVRMFLCNFTVITQ